MLSLFFDPDHLLFEVRHRAVLISLIEYMPEISDLHLLIELRLHEVYGSWWPSIVAIFLSFPSSEWHLAVTISFNARKVKLVFSLIRSFGRNLLWRTLPSIVHVDNFLAANNWSVEVVSTRSWKVLISLCLLGSWSLIDISLRSR